jgi:tagatose-1,6-bisphosphate aldolase non-catalytic subunit AgaZ/GatZ
MADAYASAFVMGKRGETIMNQNNLTTYVSYLLQNQNDQATMLGIGPMSESLITACFELAKADRFPLMFIASRNQVDLDELGGGYVCGWDQRRFAADLKRIAEEVNFTGDYFLCRDHGGPWQRDKERNDHLAEQDAMKLAHQSYEADLLNGFDLLHIDPTKDPYITGKVIPLDVVLDRTINLIRYCESFRKENNLPEVAYEVGTEETNGGLTSSEVYEGFIKTLTERLDAESLPRPAFIVGQTGTLTRLTENVGHFSAENAKVLSNLAKKYGVGLKEHNGDYLPDTILLQHPAVGITAMNVAPSYGTAETRAYLNLMEVERREFEAGRLEKRSSLHATLQDEVLAGGRFKKWLVGEQLQMTKEELKADKDLMFTITELAGHYTYNNETIKNGLNELFENLSALGIDGRRYAINQIKKVIRNEAECFNLVGLTDRINK